MKNSLTIFFLFFTTLAYAQSPIMPDVQTTPGNIDYNANKEKICTPGYSASVRHVTDKTKQEVFKLYRIDPNSDKFEVDHLIPLELGGNNEILNLWPQSYTNPEWNAHDKDKLENRLHKLVCYGVVNLTEVQILIAKDWIYAYKKYIGDK